MKYTLDVGCGYDKKHHTKKGDIGIDLKPGLCDIVAAAYFLPFRKNCFKRAIMSHVLEHLDNPIKALDEINRVLYRNGLLEIEVPNPHSFYVFKDIFLRKQGFLKISSEHTQLYGETELNNLLFKTDFRMNKITYSTPVWTCRKIDRSLFKKIIYNLLWNVYPMFKNAIKAEFMKN